MPLSWSRLAVLLFAVLAATHCRRDERTIVPRRVDLLRSFDSADRRPRGAVFTTAIVTLGGETLPALDVPAMSRVVWTSRMPDHAVLQTALGVPTQMAAPEGGKALFRIGIADERTYEGLLSTEIDLGSTTRGWEQVSIDLSKYGGFKWSLFYRPREKTWHIIFNTTITRLGRNVDATDRLFWGRPSIDPAR
jgi:hypothetical protein